MGAQTAAVVAAFAVAAVGVLSPSADHRPRSAPPTALVIDAAAARDGRDLVDDRLEDAGAEVRLPRTAAEARVDLRYLAAQGFRIVVTGPRATEAARATGLPAGEAESLAAALTAAR